MDDLANQLAARPKLLIHGRLIESAQVHDCDPMPLHPRGDQLGDGARAAMVGIPARCERRQHEQAQGLAAGEGRLSQVAAPRSGGADIYFSRAIARARAQIAASAACSERRDGSAASHAWSRERAQRIRIPKRNVVQATRRRLPERCRSL